MSAPHSLYVNLEIKKEKLEEFLREKPRPLLIDDNIMNWWKSRKMYSPRDITTIPQKDLYYQDSTNDELIKSLLSNQRMVAHQHYNDDEQKWVFLVLQLSENYIEILPMISLLKQLATYQNKKEKGIAIIYDFLWEDKNVMATLHLSDSQATLSQVSEIAAIDAEIVAKANKSLEQVLDEFNEQFED